MAQCRYVIPGLILSMAAGYALSLLVPFRSFKRAFSGITGEKDSSPPNEPLVQQNDPYIEGLVRELTLINT